MAELKRDDIISDDALEAPLLLAKNLEVAYDVIMKIQKSSKDSGIAVDAATNVRALSDETTKLVAEQNELKKVSKQIATIEARNNEEYIKQVKTLNEVKNALKDKTALGDQDAKTMSEQNASIKQLNAALQSNKKAYEELAGAEARESKEGKELLKVIQAQDTQLKSLKETIGENQLKVGQYENATKHLKIQLKEAKDEMVGIAATLGADSEEFKEAAAKAGNLNDEINDINDSMKAVAGSKFENIGSSLSLVGQKVRALDFKGASSAVKQFRGAIQDVSFTEIKAGAQGFGKQMLILAGQILANPLFWIPAIIAAVAFALYKLRDAIPGLTKAFSDLGDGIGWVVQQGKDFLDWVGLTQFAVDEQRQAIADAASENIKTLSDYYDKQIALTKAAGKETVALEIQKNRDLAAEAVKGMREINKQRADYGDFASKEQEEQYNEFKKVQADANFQIKLIETQHKHDLQKIEDDAAKVRADKAKAEAEKRRKEAEAAAIREIQDRFKLDIFYKQAEEKKLEQIEKDTKAEIDARLQASEDLEKVRGEIATLEMNAALAVAGLSTSAQVLIFQQFQNKLGEIAKKGFEERQGIAKDYSTDYNADNKKRIDAEKEFIDAMYNAEKDRLDRRIQLIKQDVIDGKKTKEQGDKELLALEKQFTESYIELIIDRIKRTLDIKGLSKEEEAKLMEELAELQKQLTNARYENVTKGEKKTSEKIQEWWDDNGKYVTGAIDAIGQVSSAFTERRLAELDAASKENKERLEKDLATEELANARRLKDATLTEEQRAILEATAEERKKTLELAAAKREEDIRERKNKALRKQAILDKAMAIVSSQIQVALSIVKTAGEMGFPAAIPFIAIAAALGAAQVAAIIAKPIPAAERGIRGHKGGLILAGEKGEELVRMPGNRLALTDAVPTVYDFPRGTDIIPHEETLKMLAGDSLRISGARGQRGDGYQTIERKLDKINSTIKNKREWNLVGRVTGYNEGGTRAKYIESLRNRPH